MTMQASNSSQIITNLECLSFITILHATFPDSEVAKQVTKLFNDVQFLAVAKEISDKKASSLVTRCLELMQQLDETKLKSESCSFFNRLITRIVHVFTSKVRSDTSS